VVGGGKLLLKRSALARIRQHLDKATRRALVAPHEVEPARVEHLVAEVCQRLRGDNRLKVYLSIALQIPAVAPPSFVPQKKELVSFNREEVGVGFLPCSLTPKGRAQPELSRRDSGCWRHLGVRSRRPSPLVRCVDSARLRAQGPSGDYGLAARVSARHAQLTSRELRHYGWTLSPALTFVAMCSTATFARHLPPPSDRGGGVQELRKALLSWRPCRHHIAWSLNNLTPSWCVDAGRVVLKQASDFDRRLRELLFAPNAAGRDLT
jgi:hypothetical protein